MFINEGVALFSSDLIAVVASFSFEFFFGSTLFLFKGLSSPCGTVRSMFSAKANSCSCAAGVVVGSNSPSPNPVAVVLVSVP